jgi:hypothetical protein
MRPRVKTLLTSTAIFILTLTYAHAAKADSFVIQNGTVVAQRSVLNVFTISIAGTGAAMSSGIRTFGGNISAANQCFAGGPCVAGSSINLGSGTGPLNPSDFTGGFVEINGTHYFISTSIVSLPPPGGLAISGSAFFLAGNVIIPVTDDEMVTLTSPFTMTSGFVGRGDSGTFLFDFTGSGIATIVLTGAQSANGGRTYVFQSITYAFTPTAVPEPTTIVTLALGLSGLGARFFKKQRARKKS